MAWDIHLHVCFPCRTNDGVAELAKKHLPTLNELDHEATWFLENLAERTGANPGPKGGLSLWGIVGNHTRADRFVEVLKPFWEELLSDNCEGGPVSFEYILVFYEEEQSHAANAYEIFWDNDRQWDRKLVVLHHEHLPFRWMQY